jgi:hypothetical protein
MIKITPVGEDEASAEVKNIYSSVRIILGVSSVPLIFKYMAAFPSYFSYIWEQTIKNLDNSFYTQSTKEIEKFACRAIDEIYNPSSLTFLFLKKNTDSAEKKSLNIFSEKNIIISAKLYLLALSIRESIKGKFLGIKQFGEKITEKERKIFTNFYDGFTSDESEENRKQNNKITDDIKKVIISEKTHNSITKSITEEFFQIVDIEMKKLTKTEDYLTRRVELERFALNKLYLLPYPLDSSLSTIIAKGYHNPHFPELIYLVSELFPTETPYKLMASALMMKILTCK